MKGFKSTVLQDFSNPTALPADESQPHMWQQHPMRYDWNESIPNPEFSKEIYNRDC